MNVLILVLENRLSGEHQGIIECSQFYGKATETGVVIITHSLFPLDFDGNFDREKHYKNSLRREENLKVRSGTLHLPLVHFRADD